ncbi:MAG TPA: glycoside hydrolase family 172 protein [Chthonomonadaceae bacterium]|nr:glycoside hydrolase family 172 protein [Chthonomonadaceae bacterium]
MMRVRGLGKAGCALLLMALSATLARAQVPADLADKKDFSALRASSTDPKGANGDMRKVPAGETLTVADIKGAGRITHLWFTIAAPSEDHLRELVLRIYWDDAVAPAVECPIGDFFALGHAKYVEFASAAVSIGAHKGLNCYWPMPFKKHAMITVTNEGSKQVDALYFNLDYRLDKRMPRDVRYFHTQYRTYFPAPVGKDLTICDVKGAGHYVGTFVSVMANSDGWWGEGNDYFFVDGAAKPTISGTGSEDYFCGGWDFGRSFWTPYFGVPYYDNAEKGGEKRGILNTCYRWHIQDPIPFQKSLLFTLEHGKRGGDRDRKPFTNHYTTVGYYYIDHPEGDGPILPDYKSRVPTLIPLPTEEKKP